MSGISIVNVSAACLKITVSDTGAAPAVEGIWQTAIASSRSAQARAISEVMKSGLTCAVSFITFSNRFDADSAVPRAWSIWFSGRLKAPSKSQFFLIVPLEPSSQSLHVPVCQGASDNILVIVVNSPLYTCLTHYAP